MLASAAKFSTASVAFSTSCLVSRATSAEAPTAPTTTDAIPSALTTALTATRWEFKHRRSTVIETLPLRDSRCPTSDCCCLHGLDPSPGHCREHGVRAHSLRRPRSPWIDSTSSRASGAMYPDLGRASALLRRLPHEASELRRDLRALARRALGLRLLALRDGHGQLEGLRARLAEELVTRHGVSPRFSSHLGRRDAPESLSVPTR